LAKENGELTSPEKKKGTAADAEVAISADLTVRLTKTVEVEGAGLRLKKYLARPAGGMAIRITEREFLCPGMGERTVAVVVENQGIEPGSLHGSLLSNNEEGIREPQGTIRPADPAPEENLRLVPGRGRVVAGSLLIVVVGYKASRSSATDRSRGQEKTREISLEPDMIQKTLLREQRKEIESMQAQIAKLAKEEENRLRPGTPPPPVPAKTTLPEIPSAEQVAQSASPSQYGNVMTPRFPAPPTVQSPPPPPPKEEKIIGGIGILSNQAATPPAPKEAPDKKRGADRSICPLPSWRPCGPMM